MAKKKYSYPKSFGNYGLSTKEDERLIELLDQKDLSSKQLVRALLKEWIANDGEGVLKYAKNLAGR